MDINNVPNLLGSISGLNVGEVNKLWEAAKDNAHKLRMCTKHDFSIEIKGRSGSTLDTEYVCTNCHGKVRHEKKYWYELGMKHYGDTK